MTTLFEPVKIGRNTAKNRIFMAPMSRYRAPDAGKVPAMTVDYYRQRATAGLVIAESTRINDWSGAMNCPGIHNDDQVAAWKDVTDAVHAEGGLIFLQLWHSGRAAHATHLPEGRVVVAPSAVPSTTNVLTENGFELPTPPKALTLEEIGELRTDFANASRKALEAGFDGVEIHGAGGFLIDTFLQKHTNKRTDQYGGTVENRFRFLREVLEDSIGIWGADRVAVKLSPTSPYNDMGQGDVKGTFSYVYSQLDSYGLAFLEVNEQFPFGEDSAENAAIIAEMRALWTGAYVANGNATFESGTARVADGTATAISYGRPYIANPDLPQRFKQGAALAEPNMETFYGGDETGYTTYPTLQEDVKMSPDTPAAADVRSTIEGLIASAGKNDLSVLDGLYHEDMQIFMLGANGAVQTANKAQFIAQLTEIAANGNMPDTWADFHHVEADDTHGHVVISRKVNLGGGDGIITLSIDLIHQDGRWQITREVIAAA